MELLSRIDTSKLVELHAAGTSDILTGPATAPTTDELGGWRTEGWAVRGAFVSIIGSDASVDIAGAVEVAIYLGAVVGWTYVATLDGGAAINVGNGAPAGAPTRSWKLYDVATATAIRLKGGAITNGTIRVVAMPILIWEGGA
jgi:hypothetical protein